MALIRQCKRVSSTARGSHRPPTATRAANKSGYTNPQIDALLERLESTILAAERTTVEADILKLATTDLPYLPLYLTVQAAAVAARVKNVSGPNPYIGNAWDLPAWDIVEEGAG